MCPIVVSLLGVVAQITFGCCAVLTRCPAVHGLALPRAVLWPAAALAGRGLVNPCWAILATDVMFEFSGADLLLPCSLCLLLHYPFRRSVRLVFTDESFAAPSISSFPSAKTALLFSASTPARPSVLPQLLPGRSSVSLSRQWCRFFISSASGRYACDY